MKKWNIPKIITVKESELKELIESVKDVQEATQYPPGPRMQFEKENVKKRAR